MDSDDTFSIDTALLSPFLTFDSKPVPTGLCPLTPALLPTSSIHTLELETGHHKTQDDMRAAFIKSTMLSPAITPVLGPLTPGDLLRFGSNEPSSDNIKSKFYTLFPNYKKSNDAQFSLNEEYKESNKLSHKEAEQRRRDEFKEKLQNLKGVLGVKKHATKAQIVEMAKETIVDQKKSISELEEMVRVLLAERGL
jgi:hypothetical protein